MTTAANNQQAVHSSKTTGEQARICIPTWRRFSPNAFRGPLYEAQDVFAQVDNVDLIQLEPESTFQWREKWLRKLIWKDFTRQLVHLNPGLMPIQLSHNYELLVVMCQQWWELLNLNAIKGWRNRCRKAVCWIDEVYVAEIRRRPNWLNALEQFDHIILPYKQSAYALSEILDRPCHYISRAVDVIRFSPYPFKPERAIDVLSIGRRWEGIHNSLLELGRTGQVFYMHDTVMDGGDQRIQDMDQHRSMLANLIKRSRFFMVAPGKMLDDRETQGQMEPGMRYFEGAASGAVLIGQAVDTDAFRALFDWPQAVIPIQPDGSDVGEKIHGLKGQPELLRNISERNAARCAERHDWMHRWEAILRIAGMEPTSRLDERKARLMALSNDPLTVH